MRRWLWTALLVAGPLTAWSQDQGDRAKGQAYAERVCAECHGVRLADSFSPRLGLATFRTIANTPGMTGTALAVWLQTPHKTMPNFMLERAERDDLIAYIVSLREPR